MLGNAQPKAFKRHPHLNEPISSTRLDDEHPALRDCWNLNQMNVQAMNPHKTLLVLTLYGISTCLFAQDKILDVRSFEPGLNVLRARYGSTPQLVKP